MDLVCRVVAGHQKTTRASIQLLQAGTGLVIGPRMALLELLNLLAMEDRKDLVVLTPNQGRGVLGKKMHLAGTGIEMFLEMNCHLLCLMCMMDLACQADLTLFLRMVWVRTLMLQVGTGIADNPENSFLSHLWALTENLVGQEALIQFQEKVRKSLKTQLLI